MGLDMYAVRRNYVSTWENQPPEERYEVQVARGGEPVREILPERISAIEEEVMYWRKANHIHQWFVDNVQDGNDDCGRYCVSPEQLQALLETCEQVIEASKLVDGEVSAGTVYDQDNPQGHRGPDHGPEASSEDRRLLLRKPAIRRGLPGRRRENPQLARADAR